MSLPQADVTCLVERGHDYTVQVEASMTCVVIKNYVPPKGYNQEQVDLLLRLNPGFPDVPPDMWWFSPPLLLANGRHVQATEVTETHLGKAWQRWSRHLGQGQWRSGIDSLESFLALIRQELQRSVGTPA